MGADIKLMPNPQRQEKFSSGDARCGAHRHRDHDRDGDDDPARDTPSRAARRHHNDLEPVASRNGRCTRRAIVPMKTARRSRTIPVKIATAFAS